MKETLYMAIEPIIEWMFTLAEQLLVQLLVLGIIASWGWTKRTWIKRHLPPLNTPERTMRSAKKMLDGWYSVEKDGEIVFQPPVGAQLDSHLPVFRKALLYIFAARDAYDLDRRETPIVTNHELAEREIFCDPDFPSYRIDGVSVEVSEPTGEKGEIYEYELKGRKADEVAEYIKQIS